MVGLPEMRRGSLTLVTRPSTVEPTGITVAPLTTTGWVTFAWKGAPRRCLKVRRVVSSCTMRAVPAGTGTAGCAVTVGDANARCAFAAGTGGSVWGVTAGADESVWAVPAGAGESVGAGESDWAVSAAAKSRMEGRAIQFFTAVPPQISEHY